LKNPTGQFSVDEGITKWSLSDPNNHVIFYKATQGLGAVKYKDIINVGAQVMYNSTYVTNYCFIGRYGYDDTQSMSAKVDYMLSKMVCLDILLGILNKTATGLFLKQVGRSVLLRAVKTGQAVRAGPFNPINYRAWALNIEPEFE